jgi:hypothetical protein
MMGESIMNRLVRVLLFCPLWLVAAGVSAQDKLAERPYFPLQVGTTWHYKVGDRKLTIRVSKHEKVGDVLCALLEVTRDGKVIASEHLSVSVDGVYRHDQTKVEKDGKTTTQTMKPPILVLKLPAEKGEKWQVDSKADGDSLRGTYQIAGEEEVKVPAGTYKALRVVSLDLEVNGLKPVLTTYYAAGVGMVKQVIQVGAAKTEFELTKFETGK